MRKIISDALGAAYRLSIYETIDQDQMTTLYYGNVLIDLLLYELNDQLEITQIDEHFLFI